MILTALHLLCFLIVFYIGAYLIHIGVKREDRYIVLLGFIIMVLGMVPYINFGIVFITILYTIKKSMQ